MDFQASGYLCKYGTELESVENCESEGRREGEARREIYTSVMLTLWTFTPGVLTLTSLTPRSLTPTVSSQQGRMTGYCSERRNNGTLIYSVGVTVLDPSTD